MEKTGYQRDTVQRNKKGWKYRFIVFVPTLRRTGDGFGWGAKDDLDFRRIRVGYWERIYSNFVDPRHPVFSNRFSDGGRAYLRVAMLGESSPAGSIIAVNTGVGGIG